MTNNIKRAYGWKRDQPDFRDFNLPTPTIDTVTFNPLLSLRDMMPPVYDQLQLGACVGNAVAGDVESIQTLEGQPAITPSRLFLYYGARSYEGTTDQDAGAQIRDGIKAAAKLGAPAETLWPYSDAQPGPFNQKPPQNVYAEALKHRAIRYYRIKQDIWDLQWCITHKYPVVFGFTVYDSFESQQVADTGIMPMPQTTENVVGGHAVLAVGYDVNRQLVEVRNSWGPNWGDHGYFWMPFQYYTNFNLSSDFWTIRKEA